jgi:hypothetical protein
MLKLAQNLVCHFSNAVYMRFISVKHEKGEATVRKNRQMQIFYGTQEEKYGFVNSVFSHFNIICVD